MIEQSDDSYRSTVYKAVNIFVFVIVVEKDLP